MVFLDFDRKVEMVPILITTFRRPKFLKILLEKLSDYDGDVFIWMNGPANESDEDLILESSRVIDSFINLKIASVKINEVHYSSGHSIALAITWFFQNVSSGIILEDDIIPSADFLKVTNAALNVYENDINIGSILGSNFTPKDSISDSRFIYRCSSFVSSWGWATWKSRWDVFESELNDWKTYERHLPESVNTYFGRRKWHAIHSQIAGGHFDAWDYRWQFAGWKHGLLHLAPNYNLVENIGFDSHATHTFQKPDWFHGRVEKMPRDLELASAVLKLDLEADDWISRNIHHSKNWYWIKTLAKRKLNQISKINSSGT